MPEPFYSLRAAACIERLDDGKEWSIYLCNDGSAPLDRVELLSFGHSWGGSGEVQDIGREIGAVPPGEWLRVWRDDDFEMRMYLQIAIEVKGKSRWLMADFPKLYRRKRKLPTIEDIGLPGFVVPLKVIG